MGWAEQRLIGFMEGREGQSWLSHAHWIKGAALQWDMPLHTLFFSTKYSETSRWTELKS